MKKTLVLAMVLVSACLGQVFAEDLSPTDDAATLSSLPDNNFGTIHVNLWTSPTARSYFIFDLSDYASIDSAKLYLYKKTGTGTTSVSAYSTSSAWTEGSLTWNNQPSLQGTPVTTSVGTNGWYFWDVTSFAQAAAGNTLALGLTSTGVQRTFSSAEDTGNWPYLRVVGTAAPEPVSSALFVLGGGLLAAYRARKNKR